MSQIIPTIEDVKRHFKNAKEIRCLSLDIVVDVSYVVNFTYDEKSNSYVSIGGMISFWKDGHYATITKKKCNPETCTGCKPCQEKKNKYGQE